MPRAGRDNAKIGHNFASLRRLLKMTQAQAVKASGGLLAHGEVSRVERGRSGVSTVAKRKALAVAYGLDVATITALVEGRITAAQAFDTKRRQPLAPTTSADVGSLASKGEEMLKGLELCVAYHEQSGKVWRASTLAAARTGEFGDDKTTPARWAAILDDLERALRALESPSSADVSQGDENDP